MKNAVLLLLMLIVGGCGFAALPQPTSKTVKPEDIASTWQYTADYGKTIIKLEMKSDGTFSQSVQPAGQTNVLIQSGVWTLDERNNLTFTSVLTHEGFSEEQGWVPEEAHWWVTDGIGKQAKVVIFGGTHPDPDSWRRFRRLR